MTSPKYSLIKKCVLCQSTPKQWETIFSLNSKQKLVKCRQCSLIFNDFRRIDFDQIYTNSYYDKDQNIGSGGGFYDYQEMEKAFQRFYRFAYNFIIKQSRKKSKINLLDIGCSYGFFLKQFLPDKRFVLSGVELNQQAATIAKKNCHHLYPIPIEKFNPKQSYNFVIAFELIEHTLNPAKIIKKISSLQKSGDYLLLTTPDAGSPFFKLLGKNWSSIHPAVHNFYFTEKTIIKILKQYNYQPIKVNHNQIFWSDVFHLRKRLSEMLPFLKHLIKPFSIFDSLIIPFPDGGDLQIVFQKQ